MTRNEAIKWLEYIGTRECVDGYIRLLEYNGGVKNAIELAIKTLKHDASRPEQQNGE